MRPTSMCYIVQTKVFHSDLHVPMIAVTPVYITSSATSALPTSSSALTLPPVAGLEAFPCMPCSSPLHLQGFISMDPIPAGIRSIVQDNRPIVDLLPPHSLKRVKLSARPRSKSPPSTPLPDLPSSVVATFLHRIKLLSPSFDGKLVPLQFFSDLVSPEQPLTALHLDYIMRSFYRSRCANLLASRTSVADTHLMRYLSHTFTSYQDCSPSIFHWPTILLDIVRGYVTERDDVSSWFTAVDMIYAHMHWGDQHWVALLINLRTYHIDIFDHFRRDTVSQMVSFLMAPVLHMLPQLIRSASPSNDVRTIGCSAFTFSRLTGLSQHVRLADCAAFVVKFIDLHSHGLSLSGITDASVDNMRLAYALSLFNDLYGHIP